MICPDCGQMGSYCDDCMDKVYQDLSLHKNRLRELTIALKWIYEHSNNPVIRDKVTELLGGLK